ncbi:MAG: Proline iminopeptidase [Candidatus Celerinatantimonas neptuna]|nr:MAG: Proline iminopeptidase [Candidatus Celerinatantimonas neptuna]
MSQYTLSGMLIRDYQFNVPLDWQNPDPQQTIPLFSREIVDPSKDHQSLPLLLFLQGGPGCKSPRPLSSGLPWLSIALKTHRIILLDQRGTGRSARVNSQLIAQMTPEEGRDYLLHFRADSIVADCEHLRQTRYKGVRWETLGQSYGGFITLTYLSIAPQGLSGCYITGGLAGLHASADDVYKLTYQSVAEKNAIYYQRYPQDAKQIARIADILAHQDIRLPDHSLLSLERFQSLGILLGSGSGLEQMHWLIEEALETTTPGQLSHTFLSQVLHLSNYIDNPLYAVMHESIYGQSQQPTNWAAARIKETCSEFSTDKRPLMFTGEMIYPWMFKQIHALQPFAQTVEKLATYTGFTPLYKPDVLASNRVPVAAAVYQNDMYVPRTLSLDTADHIPNLHTWVSNEFEHDGLRQSPHVFMNLRQMMFQQGGPLPA